MLPKCVLEGSSLPGSQGCGNPGPGARIRQQKHQGLGRQRCVSLCTCECRLICAPLCSLVWSQFRRCDSLAWQAVCTDLGTSPPKQSYRISCSKSTKNSERVPWRGLRGGGRRGQRCDRKRTGPARLFQAHPQPTGKDTRNCFGSR